MKRDFVSFSFLRQQLRYSVSFEVLFVGGKRSAEEASCRSSCWRPWLPAGKTANRSNSELCRQASWMIFMEFQSVELTLKVYNQGLFAQVTTKRLCSRINPHWICFT